MQLELCRPRCLVAEIVVAKDRAAAHDLPHGVLPYRGIRRCLAAARRAEERNEFALVDGDVDIADHRGLRETLGDIFDGKKSFAHGPHSFQFGRLADFGA